VKAILSSSATSLSGTSTLCQGSGSVDVMGASNTGVPKASKVFQTHPLSTGAGTLEAARGTDHLEQGGVVLAGEQDIMGNPWIGFNEAFTVCQRVGKGKDAVTVCTDAYNEVPTLWDGGDWNGTTWSGTTWSGVSWSGVSWSGTTWSGVSWSGVSWSGTTWSDRYWNGTTWSGTTWSGTTWSGTTWSGAGWLGQTWG
jgi:serine protease AprX